MATLAPAYVTVPQGRDRFFSGVAIVMAAVVAVAFSMQYLAGRSTFHVPLVFHAHAVAFMGWVALFTVQAQLGAGAETPALHRRLGWIGAGWAALLVVLGCAITVYVVRQGIAPFFFRPQHFLIANPIGVLTFAGFTWAAVRLRRRTDWHRRLHICGMSMIMGPAFGRLLPMPFIGPHAFDIAVASGLVFVLAGMARDQLRYARIHPAWWFGLAAVPITLLIASVITYSPVGDALYRVVTRGAPGAAVSGLAFGPPPPGLHGGG